MNPKLTASLLILAAVLANVGFTALGSIFNYPDVLDEPAGDVLASFRDHEGAVSAWFSVLALSAALLAPIAIGVGRLSPARAMRIAVRVGIAAAVVQVIGLLRWPILVPGYASDAASGDAAVAAGARDAFTTASDILGTAIGETLGYLLTATWTVLVIVALGRALRRALVRGARRGVRGARPRRRPLAARAAGGRHRELLRLRPLEHLADRLRRRDPGARAARRRRAVGPEPGGGDVVTGARGAGLALGVLCASLLAIVVDNTIVNVALPTLARDLDADVSELQWVVDAYTLVFAGAAAAGRRARRSLRAPPHAARGARRVRRSPRRPPPTRAASIG